MTVMHQPRVALGYADWQGSDVMDDSRTLERASAHEKAAAALRER
jgi:hypothetical protein